MAEFNYAKSSDKSLRGMSYEIRNILSGGITSDDSTFSLRLIDRVIKDFYAEEIKREDDLKEAKGEKLDSIRMTPFCVNLEQSDDFNCSCTEKSGKLMKAKLPEFIQSRGMPYISYFGNTDMDFEFVPANSIGDLNAKYSSGLVNKPIYVVAGNTAYVALQPDYILMCKAGVMGIPADPLATTAAPCFDIWSQEWKISSHMRARVKARTLEFLGNPLNVTSQNRDLRNNAQAGNQSPVIQNP